MSAIGIEVLPTAQSDVPVIPGLTDEERVTLGVLHGKWSGCLPRNRMRAARYDGKNAVRDLGMSTPPQLRQLAAVLGWPALAIDLLSVRCRLDGFSLLGVDVEQTGLPDAWSQNRADTLLKQAQVSALTHSPGYLIVTRGDTSAGEPEALVTARDALNGYGEWNARRQALDNFLSIAGFDAEQRISSFALYLPNHVVVASKGDGGKWAVERSDHDAGVPVEPLTFSSDLRRPMGRSRISRSIMSLHDMALRTLRRSEITAEWYSRPQAIMLGADESAFGGKSAWQVLLGAVWGIPDDEDATNPRADVKQLAAAPQTPHLEQLAALGRAFAAEAKIPVSSLGVTSDANPVSADAYVASREDLISLAEDTTAEWSPSVARTQQRILAITDGARAASVRVVPRWRNPLYTSRAQAADAGQKVIASVPWLGETRVGLELLGLTPQQIDEALGDRDRAQATVTARMIAEAAANGRSARA